MAEETDLYGDLLKMCICVKDRWELKCLPYVSSNKSSTLSVFDILGGMENRPFWRGHVVSPVLRCPQVASVVQANIKMFEELKLYRSAENSQQRIDQLVSGRL